MPPRTSWSSLQTPFEPVPDGCIHIEKIKGPFLYQPKDMPAEYKAGLERAIANRGARGDGRLISSLGPLARTCPKHL
jgi:hypothetical protein